MTKGIITLYVEREEVSIAKSLGLNLSQEFRNFLAVAIQNKDIRNMTNEKEKNILLEVKMAELISRLEEANKNYNKILQENQELKVKLQELNNKRTPQRYETQRERAERRRNELREMGVVIPDGI